MQGGWDLEQSIAFCRKLKDLNIDLIDVSTGGNVPRTKIPVAPNYQVKFAAAIRERVGIKTGAVGMITQPQQAEEILQRGEADAVLMAREWLRDPYFVFRAARELGVKINYIPQQYGRAIEIESASEVIRS